MVQTWTHGMDLDSWYRLGTHGMDLDSWYRLGLMLYTWSHGIHLDSWYRIVLLNHTNTRGSSFARMWDFCFVISKTKVLYFRHFGNLRIDNFHWISPLGRFSLWVEMSVSRVCVCVCHHGNPASRWTGDFGSKNVSLILSYLLTFFGF